MLMAAVTLTSRDPEMTSIRSAPSALTESTGMSFVDSLAENTAQTEERPSDVGGQAKAMSVVESDGTTAGKTASVKISAAESEARSVSGTAEKLKNEVGNVKSFVSSGVGSATGLVLNKTNSRGTGPTLAHNGIPNETNATSQSTISDDQPMPHAPGTERNQGVALAHDSAEKTGCAGPQIATPVAAAGTDGSVKQVISDKEETLIPRKGLSKSAVAIAVSDQETSVKAVKSAKAEAKQDKKDKTGVIVRAAGVDAQATALIQVFVNPAGAKQSGGGDAEADVLPSTPAVTSGRSAAIVAAAKGRNDKATENPVKPGENSAENTVSSAGETPLSQKSGADASKPESAIAANQNIDKPKPQSTVPPAADLGQLRAVSAASIAAPGIVSGSALTHNAAVAPHTAETISHASAQPGLNVIDATSPGDASQKTLTATPTSLEVGVANGTHGWLKIRAEMADGGAVNASLSISSTAGQEMLHRELPSLAAYLKSEHVAVSTVVVQPMAATGSDPRGSFAGANGSAQGQAQQSGSQGRESRQNSTPAPAGTSVPYSGPGTVNSDEVFSSASHGQGGGWLSVRA